MVWKKLAVILVAAVVMISGAIFISMSLTEPKEMELEVESHENEDEVAEEPGVKTIENMENPPLYFDAEDVLLVPLRTVVEGMGGTTAWDKEKKMVSVKYRGMELALKPEDTKAFLNGYEITLERPAAMINGCLYASSDILPAYFTTEVIWNEETEQITLKTGENKLPVIAKKVIEEEKDGRSFYAEVPVAAGLNDVSFEKKINTSYEEKAQEWKQSFQNGETGSMELSVQTGFVSAEFLSFLWQGEKDGQPFEIASDIDLGGQRRVLLSDVLTEDSVNKAREAAGEDFREEGWYITEAGDFVLICEGREYPLKKEDTALKKEFSDVF